MLLISVKPPYHPLKNVQKTIVLNWIFWWNKTCYLPLFFPDSGPIRP